MVKRCFANLPRTLLASPSGKRTDGSVEKSEIHLVFKIKTEGADELN